MSIKIFQPGRLAALLGTAAFIAAIPFHFGLDAADGGVTLKPAEAIAKGSNSGPGGGGNSGPGGSDNDYNDDNDDDDDDDDHGGRHGGHGADDIAGGAAGGAQNGSVAVTKIEVSATGVEVRFSDGTKEEIENGRYERKNAAGRTVEERPATQADLDRLLGLN